MPQSIKAAVKAKGGLAQYKHDIPNEVVLLYNRGLKKWK